MAAVARQAAAIAKANSRHQTRRVELAPTPGVGEISWATPIRKNAMAVPIKDKVDLLLGVNAAAMKAGADFFNSTLFLINEQKYFASTDGSYIDQDVHRIWLPITATAVDKASGKFRTRNGLSAPMGMGYEYLDADPAGKFKLPGGVTGYGRSYDVMEDAVASRRDARAKLKAPSVKPGKYDLVIDPSNLFLTIHENVGHPLELDRVLGYEANYAGTSFATLDKRDERLSLGQRHRQLRRRQDPSGQPRRGRLRRRRREDQAVGPGARRHPRRLPGHARRGAHPRPQRIARLQLCRLVVERAVPAHGQRLADAGQDAAERRRHGQGRRERPVHPRPRLVLDRPAALQRPVRRPAVLRDQATAR